MKLLTTDDLKLLTRDELVRLIERISIQLGKLAAGSIARADALQTLANIRAELARRDHAKPRLRVPTP